MPKFIVDIYLEQTKTLKIPVEAHDQDSAIEAAFAEARVKTRDTPWGIDTNDCDVEEVEGDAEA